MTKMLTAKFMKLKLKNGWTKSDFSTYLGCSEEEVRSLVTKVFTKDAANDMLSQMSSNNKKKHRKKSTTSVVDSKIETSEPGQSSAHSPEENEEKEEVTGETMQIEENITVTSSHTELEHLQQKESQLSNELCKLEVEHKKLTADKRALKHSLKREKEYMLQLRSQIEEHQRVVEAIINQVNDLNSNISTLNEEISASRQDLATLHREIEELTKAVIFVYENGSIETENLEQALEIPDSWQDIYNQLRENPLAEDITLKQAKQLSKVIAFAKVMQKRNLSFEVTWENEYLEDLFKELNS